MLVLWRNTVNLGLIKWSSWKKHKIQNHLWSDRNCYQEADQTCVHNGQPFSVRARWRCLLHWVGPQRSSGCLSSPCKNAVLFPPAWSLPALARSRPAPGPRCSPHSAPGSPSRQPSECACHHPEPGGNSEPALPVNIKKRKDIGYCKALLMEILPFFLFLYLWISLEFTLFSHLLRDFLF